MAEEAEIEMPSRLPGGGPTGKAPLVRALRARQPDLKKVACLWLDRFHSEKYGALAELIGLVMAVADISGETTVMKEDLEERAPPEVVSELAAALVQEAVEKGADFSQHWLVSREKGAVRVRENFPAIWRELALAPNTEDLLGDLVQRLRAWTLSLAECQIRGIRHAATVAGLGLVEGMQIQCNHIQEWCDTAEVRLQDTESAAKAALGKELKRNRQCLKNLRAARDGLAGALLSKRSKDVEPDIRRSCCEALQRWAELGCEVTWKQYLHFLIQDREPKVRAAALQALVPLLRMREAAPLSAEVKSVAEELRPRVLERCQDPDATVAAAALCCACALAKAEVLKEEDFDPLIDLLWDAEAARRDAACIFVSRFVLNEDVMDLPGGAGTGSKRLLEMLLDFLHEFLDGHYELTERLVAALWRKASCLEDWEAMTALLLSEELKPEQHTVSAYLAEATVRWAVDEWLGTGSSHSEALLQHAARALGPRLPQLLAAFQSEKATMQKTASLCSHLLRFCSLSPQSSGGLAPEAVVKVLCSAFIRQTDPEALEHLALALAALLELSSATRGAVHDLAKSFHQNFLQLVPHANVSGGASPDGEVRMPDSLLANAQRLRILTKAYDVSLCDVEGFVTSALDLVAQRAEESARCSVQGELVVILLELLTLISLRHAAQCSGPPLQSALGARDVRDEVQLKQAPTAAEDFLNLARLLLQRDEDPRVRTAAFAGALATLSAWWNAAQQSEQAEKPWSCGCSEQLQHALSDHLGKLLAEANTVPTDCVLVSGLGEPSASSAFSRLFVLLQQGLAEPSSSMLDGERVKAAQLCCLMVATCRHPEVALSSLPSLVLSLPLSPRDDLQQVAWTFLRRLRSEAHAGQAEEFFTMLLRAVKLVHEENTTAVAKDLSSRLLQHVGVGKLQPKWQDALMSVLRKGVAHASQGCSEGFLEALTPWITKHVVDDRRLEGLGTWAKEQENEALQKAGLEKLLEACEVTAKRTTEDTPPSKRRRTTKGNRKTPTSTQEIKDAMDLH